MITFNLLTDAQYQSSRLSLLLLTEGAINTPYVDTVGVPTIGIGFNLQDSTIFGLVMDAIAPTLTVAERTTLFDSLQKTFSSNSELNSSINATLASFKDPNAPTSLTFTSTAQMLNTLNTAVKTYETRVDNWLSGIPESTERVVLVSMAYNGLINSGTSPTLRQDVVNGNRADAWYQVRYQSNGGASQSVGIANRRYVEATQFGLYTNPSNPSQSEALQAAQEFTDHKSTILDYESTYSPAVAARTKGVAIPDIYGALAPAISTLESEYHIPSSANLKEVMAVTDTTPTLTGDAMNNLLIGSSAGDTLTGGSGNDYIVGNGGDDAIDGGDGIDTAVYNAKSSDYDITHNKDGTWTVADVRGAQTDGTDTLKNVEFVKFSDGARYALQPNGILDQTDFAFVVDTTGSMFPYLDEVKASISALINKLFGFIEGLFGGNTDAHISVVSFKDPAVGDPDSVILPFTTETSFADRQTAAINAIDSLFASGGGDIPEGDNSGLLLALNGSAGNWRDSAAVRRIALFTDAPVKDTDLASAVFAYAHNLGSAVTASSSAAISSDVQVSTFTVARTASSVAPSSFQVQIYTIQVGSDPTATASVEAIATANNGEFLSAPTPTDLVAALTQTIVTPQINGTVASQAVFDNATIAPFAGVALVDPTPGATDTVVVTPSSTINGVFSNLGGGTIDSRTGAYTISGTAADVAAAVDGLVFIPTPHQVAPGGSVTTSFSITATSSSGASATDTTTSVVTTAAASPSAAPYDVNGDSVSDLVFQNNGTPQIWLWNGTAVTSQMTYANPGASWHVVTSRDVNGDGMADLIWQNTDGTPSVWLMNGTTPTAAVLLTNSGPSWQLVASGDTNGDGKFDLIWQNTNGTLGVWLMNGTTPISEVGLSNPGANWKVVGSADYNGDGRDDILLQDSSTGNLMIDLMNGTTITSTKTITVGDPSWHAVSTGEFNGQAEIAWQNSNGTPSIWLMNGTTPVATAPLTNPGPGWQLISVDHFTPDGHADLLFQNTNGAMGLWEMNGTNIAAMVGVPNPGAGWQSENGHPFSPAPAVSTLPNVHV
jgi:GH24 family phage-related lysozyme (muramidase)